MKRAFSFSLSAAIVAALLAIPSAIVAQEPLSVEQPLISPALALYALQTPAAQRELRISRKQVDVIRTLTQELHEATAAKRKRNAPSLEEVTRRTDETLREVLSPEQVERLEQIVVQIPSGPELYLRPQMVERLQLTSAQVEQIEYLQMQLNLALEELNFHALLPHELADARYALQRQMEAEAAGMVLNDRQRAQMIRLVGPRFDWEPILFPWKFGSPVGGQ